MQPQSEPRIQVGDAKNELLRQRGRYPPNLADRERRERLPLKTERHQSIQPAAALREGPLNIRNRNHPPRPGPKLFDQSGNGLIRLLAWRQADLGKPDAQAAKRILKPIDHFLPCVRRVPLHTRKTPVVLDTPGFQPFGYFLNGPRFHLLGSAGILRLEVLLVLQDVYHKRMDAEPPVAVELLNGTAAQQRVQDGIRYVIVRGGAIHRQESRQFSRIGNL